MQTFLPYADFQKSAFVLDNKRLGKQRVECKQIYLSLTEPAYGWKHHPAVKMWKGKEGTLAWYGYFICKEWSQRGFRDSLLDYFIPLRKEESYPDWFGNGVFHDSHKSSLLRKNPTHYRTFWPYIPDNLPYYWPTK